MKTTSTEYIQQKHSKLFEELGCFFAFNDNQFKEGVEQAGGIDKTGKYRGVGAGLYCPSKNIDALLNGMEAIKKGWKQDRKVKEKHQLIYVGIDNWNRPVFKAPDQAAYYGSVNELFSEDATKEDVLKKVDMFDLCYFGDHFGCEPMGTDVPDKYYI